MVIFNGLNIKTGLSPRTAQLTTEAGRKEALITQFARGAEMAAFGDTDVVGLCHMEVRTEGHAILRGNTVSSAFICYKMPQNKWHKHSHKEEVEQTHEHVPEGVGEFTC